jgi:hypothetical protein
MKKIQQKSKPKPKASSPHLSQVAFIFLFFMAFFLLLHWILIFHHGLRRGYAPFRVME